MPGFQFFHDTNGMVFGVYFLFEVQESFSICKICGIYIPRKTVAYIGLVYRCSIYSCMSLWLSRPILHYIIDFGNDDNSMLADYMHITAKGEATLGHGYILHHTNDAKLLHTTANTYSGIMEIMFEANIFDDLLD